MYICGNFVAIVDARSEPGDEKSNGFYINVNKNFIENRFADGNSEDWIAAVMFDTIMCLDMSDDFYKQNDYEKAYILAVLCSVPGRGQIVPCWPTQHHRTMHTYTRFLGGI